jgi:hypothetical protein
VLGGGICECLWLGDNDVTLSMVKRAYQNFNMCFLNGKITFIYTRLDRPKVVSIGTTGPTSITQKIINYYNNH